MGKSLIEDFDDIAARLNQIERDRQIDAIKPEPDKTPSVTDGSPEDWTDVGPFCC
jgi:hypothetical protein